MVAIKRYWTALDQASRRALRRAFIIPLVIGTVLIVAAAALCMATVDDIETSAELAREFGMLQALMAATVIAGIYSYFLIYKAHKAIKENLFAHPADGRPTDLEPQRRRYPSSRPSGRCQHSRCRSWTCCDGGLAHRP